jgi:membrane protein implicated in regulation of membrane protease activity
MKEFVIYTGLRLALFLVSFGILWVAFHTWLSAWPLALLALFITAILSLFVLRSARDRLAAKIDERADRMASRIESARTAEDED